MEPRIPHSLLIELIHCRRCVGKHEVLFNLVHFNTHICLFMPFIDGRKRGWDNFWKLRKPPTFSWVCITAKKTNKMLFYNICVHSDRVVNPGRIQILRIDRGVMVDDVIMHGTWRHLCIKYSWICDDTKLAKKMLNFFSCNIWPDWFTSHQSHFYNNIPEPFMRKRLIDVNIKIAPTTQIL